MAQVGNLSYPTHGSGWKPELPLLMIPISVGNLSYLNLSTGMKQELRG